MGNPIEIPTFFIFKPHEPAITHAALCRIAQIASSKGAGQAQKALSEVLSGKRVGGYCARCGLEFEFINKIYRKKPLRLQCLDCRLTVQAIERQHGPLLSPTVAGAFQLG